jgi:HEAT repeat protein
MKPIHVEHDSPASLLAALRHPDADVRFEAAKKLGAKAKLAKGLIRDLVRATFDKNRIVRFNAVAALGLAGPRAHEAIPALLNVLRNSSEKSHLRSAAANSLGLIGKGAVPHLVEALYSRVALVRALGVTGLRVHRALNALKQMEDQMKAASLALTSMFKSADDDDRLSAVNLFAQMGQQAMPFLLKALRDSNPIISLNAARALLRLEPWHFCNRTSLRSMIFNPKPTKMRKEARAALKTLIAGLANDTPGIRLESLRYLGEIDTHAKPALKEILIALTAKESEVRQQAAFVLGVMGKYAKTAGPRLVSVLFDDDVRVRRTAASVIGKIGFKARVAIDSLFRALADQDLEVRVNAACALAELGVAPRQSIALIEKALNQCPFEDSRQMFAEAINRIKGKKKGDASIFVDT